jgi:hypothetical protein
MPGNAAPCTLSDLSPNISNKLRRLPDEPYFTPNGRLDQILQIRLYPSANFFYRQISKPKLCFLRGNDFKGSRMLLKISYLES